MRVVGSADRIKGAWVLTQPGQIPDPPGGTAIRIHQTQTSEQVRVSQRVSDLRNFGRTARRDLYERQLGGRLPELERNGFLGRDAAAFDLVQSFQDMVAHPPQDLRPSPRNKIAVLYFDGNGWGDLIRHYAKLTGERIREMTKAAEDTFADIYAALLRRFMEGARDRRYLSDPTRSVPHPHTAFSIVDSIHVPDIQPDGTDKGRMAPRHLLRLETLMIGGEDMVIVCPSWLAFEVVQTVFDVVARRERELQAGLKDFHLRGASLAALQDNLKALRKGDVLPRSQLFRWLRMARDGKGDADLRAAMDQTLKSPDYDLNADDRATALPLSRTPPYAGARPRRHPVGLHLRPR